MSKIVAPHIPAILRKYAQPCARATAKIDNRIHAGAKAGDNVGYHETGRGQASCHLVFVKAIIVYQVFTIFGHPSSICPRRFFGICELKKWHLKLSRS